tara:strand:- start:346 stop:2817 length:2472 start_codon:yes stop_codon:yes gene_type:complete
MDRRPVNLRKNRSTIKILNDRENFRKVIQDREFNLERRKQLKKLLEEQTTVLYNAQQKKVKKLKQGRGKNLRGELARNKNLQRRFERGERRYNETEEPRIRGDAAPQVVGGMQFTPAAMTPEDRQIALQRLQLQAQQQQNQFILQDRRDREELAIRRGEAQGNLLLGQQRLAQEQEDNRNRILIEQGRLNIEDYNNRERLRLDAAIAQGNLQQEQLRQQREQERENRRQEAHEGEILANLDLELERNRLRELEIENDRAIRAEEQAIRRLELEAQRENIPIPEIAGGRDARPQPFNIADHQFIGNLLTGLAQDRHREREATNNLIQQFIEHQERVQGNVSPDLLQRLFTSAQQLGLRVVGQEAQQSPNPPPPSYSQIAPSVDDVASNVRSILRNRGDTIPLSEDTRREGTQTIGVLTELEQELNRPDERLNQSIDDLQQNLQRGADNVSRFLQTAEPDLPDIDPSEVSSITSTEWDRRVNRAETEFDQTEEGLQRLLESQRFNEENPYLLIQNPLEELELTRSQASAFDRQANETTERELEALRQQGITIQRLAELQEQERTQEKPAEPSAETLETIEQQLTQEQIEIGEEEQAIEEGAGVGVLQQAGEAIGQGLVSVAGGVAEAGLGVVQGAGEAVLEQLPTPGQVGQAVGRGLVSGAGALLGAGASAVGGLGQAIVGGGQVEELEEEQQLQEATDEGELLEEIPISTQNPAQIADDSFDYGEFVVHHAEQSDKQRPPTLLERQRGAKYSIQNTSDRVHKKLKPGEKVDITSYGKDRKGESIGYYGELNPASNRRQGLPTQLQLGALNKSIDKGYLKLHKNY